MRPVGPNPNTVSDYLRTVFLSGFFSNAGPMVRKLEERVAAEFSLSPRRVVVTTNATVALTASVAVLSSSEWLVPSWTFTATVAAIRIAGARPRFIDLDPDSHWADLCQQGWRSRPAVAVAPFGIPPPLQLLQREKPTVIDAAASLGSIPMDLSHLSANNCVVFSLHATKVLGSGEGGIVVCGSDSLAESIREFINFGFANSRSSSRLGFNGKMSEYGAAIVHAALDGWQAEKVEWLAARAQVRAISSEYNLNSLGHGDQFVSPFWIVDFGSERLRDHVEAGFRERRIETRRWWGNGCHNMAAYKDFSDSDLPHTEKKASISLGLPFFRGFGKKESARVKQALDEVLTDSRELLAE